MAKGFKNAVLFSNNWLNSKVDIPICLIIDYAKLNKYLFDTLFLFTILYTKVKQTKSINYENWMLCIWVSHPFGRENTNESEGVLINTYSCQWAILWSYSILSTAFTAQFYSHQRGYIFHHFRKWSLKAKIGGYFLFVRLGKHAWNNKRHVWHPVIWIEQELLKIKIRCNRSKMGIEKIGVL